MGLTVVEKDGEVVKAEYTVKDINEIDPAHYKNGRDIYIDAVLIYEGKTDKEKITDLESELKKLKTDVANMKTR